MSCSICSEDFDKDGNVGATQIFRRQGIVVTITGIPATAVCPRCGNAVLDWDVAQQVEDLVQPLFQWADTHTLPKPVINITFPEAFAIAA